METVENDKSAIVTLPKGLYFDRKKLNVTDKFNIKTKLKTIALKEINGIGI